MTLNLKVVPFREPKVTVHKVEEIICMQKTLRNTVCKLPPEYIVYSTENKKSEEMIWYLCGVHLEFLKRHSRKREIVWPDK